MVTASKTTRPRTTPTWTRRTLLEQVPASVPGQPALKIDREKGVIYGVKVLGRYSRNNHGVVEAENGSEYSPACMRAALPQYEGAKVKLNHPPDRSRPAAEREVDDIFGVLRNVRIESEEDGVRADLHYRKFHEITPDVLDDVERQLGLWGLSHNAAAKRERFDRAAKRLVIEELAVVRSVDLVDKPATTRNLWESEKPPVATTLRDLLESQRKRFSANRLSWMDRLLEMYEDGDAAMAAPAEAPAESDPDAALAAGFRAAIMAVVDDATMDLAAKKQKIGQLLTTQDKLAAADEPAEAPESEGDQELDRDEKKEKEKQESESAELAKFRAEKKARELCESLDLKTPTAVQLAAVVGLSDDKQRRELIESFKAQPPKYKAPKSAPTGGPGKAGKDSAREVQESEKDAEKKSVADSFAILRRG